MWPGRPLAERRISFTRCCENFNRREERDRIEIALHCVAVMADGAPAFVERLPPVEADHVGASGSHRAEQPSGLDAEVDDRHAEVLHGADEAFRGYESVVVVVGQRERTNPAVEDLDDVGAGLDLETAVFDQDCDQLVQKHAPCDRLAIHQFLGLDVVARSAAFDHVAGQRVRRAAEADDAEAIAEVRGDFLDGAGDVGEVIGPIGAQGRHIGRSAHGMMHDRPFAGLELEGQAHGLERKQQVGKDDGRVDAELFSSGDGDFGGDLRLLADLDQRVVLADVAILLHVAAGLAQKPDRRAIDGLAQAGADEAVTGEKRVLDRGLRLDWHSLSILLGGLAPSTSAESKLSRRALLRCSADTGSLRSCGIPRLQNRETWGTQEFV